MDTTERQQIEARLQGPQEYLRSRNPVNIYDLGWLQAGGWWWTHSHITMTLTAPNCPMAISLLKRFSQVSQIPGYKKSRSETNV